MVNIQDIYEFEEEETLENKDIIGKIFSKQKELLEKYRHIENMPIQIDINSPEHQKLLKEFTFRGIEELAESYEAYLQKDLEHMNEEISDAIHFFTEVLLMVDIKAEEINSIDGFNEKKQVNLTNEIVTQSLWKITYDFSIACNRLKCKPWKQTQILTDINKYKGMLIQSYNNFMYTLNILGYSSIDILKLYMNKHLVNKFRIRSNY